MAERSGNEKLAFVLTGLSCVLVGKMVWDQLTHVQRVNWQRAEQRHLGKGDRDLY